MGREKSKNSDGEEAYEGHPCKPLKIQASQRNLPEQNELTENFTANGFEEERLKARHTVFSHLACTSKGAARYLLPTYRILKMHALRNDPMHRKIMKTNQVL